MTLNTVITETPYHIFPKCKTGKNGCNEAIKARVLSEEEMRNASFTDFRKGYWYLCLPAGEGITFNLTICACDPSEFSIDVLDEEWGQPYDYQHMLEASACPPEEAVRVFNNVERIMSELQDEKILSGHIRGEYI